MNVSLLNLCDLPKPLQLGSGSNEQLCSACKSYGDKETMDFLKKTYGDVILPDDRADFPICFVSGSMLTSIPKQQCQALAQGCPGDTDTDSDMMLLSTQPRWSNLNFSQGMDSPTRHSSSAGGTQVTAPLCVLGSGCIQKSTYK